MTEPDGPLPPMFFTTFAYSACKAVGNDQWPEVLRELLAHPERGPDRLGHAGLAFAALWEAMHLSNVVVHVASNSYIARARSVAAAHFLRGTGRDCDVWLSCDDDTYAGRDVLRRLVTACRATRGLVALPCANRDGQSMCLRKPGPVTEWWSPEGLVSEGLTPTDREGLFALRRVDRIGQGLVAMHRDLIAALDLGCMPSLRFADRIAPNALDCPGIFLSGPRSNEWIGEDYWLCALAEDAGLPVHVLLESDVQHETIVTKLDLQGHPWIVGQANADRMAEGLRRMTAEAQAAGRG